MKISKTNPQTICIGCNIKIPSKNWEKHIETKRHKNSFNKARKKGYPYDKIVFDSALGCKYDLISTFLPRVFSSNDKIEWSFK